MLFDIQTSVNSWLMRWMMMVSDSGPERLGKAHACTVVHRCTVVCLFLTRLGILLPLNVHSMYHSTTPRSPSGVVLIKSPPLRRAETNIRTTSGRVQGRHETELSTFQLVTEYLGAQASSLYVPCTEYSVVCTGCWMALPGTLQKDNAKTGALA
jgi:hypothetical protein